MKDAVRLAEPVDDADIRALGRAAERITLDLIDGELAAEAAGDRLHELCQDLLRVVLLGTGHECRVSRDVRHDEKTFHRRDGTRARRPPIAVRLAKQAVLAADETALGAGLEQERRLYELSMATEDRIEGMNAFLEKRAPDFKGR